MIINKNNYKLSNVITIINNFSYVNLMYFGALLFVIINDSLDTQPYTSIYNFIHQMNWQINNNNNNNNNITFTKIKYKYTIKYEFQDFNFRYVYFVFVLYIKYISLIG